MWKYREFDAYNSISLHDCRADSIRLDGSDLIFDFSAGFKITPVNPHNNHEWPVFTGPAQLCFHEVFEDMPFNLINIYKTTRLFRYPILCRRLQPEYPVFLKMFQTGKYELEFGTEYHRPPVDSLYQGYIWKKNGGMVAECQFDLFAKSIEYRWNEMQSEPAW